MDRDRQGFALLAARLARVVAVLAVLAVGGAVVDGVATGLTFGVLAVWLTAFAVASLAAAAILAGIHAANLAGRAQRGGERLGAEDVGLVPPRRGREPS